MSEEQTTMILTSSAMDIDLKEQIIIGGNKWHCVSMISKTGQILFKYGDKWYDSSNLNEVITMYHSNVVLAIYEKNNIISYEDNFAYSVVLMQIECWLIYLLNPLNMSLLCPLGTHI